MMGMLDREDETKLLTEFTSSDQAEFMALYGRRRVGKTFLIKEFFSEKKNCIFFSITGIRDGQFIHQRIEFCKQISKIFFSNVPIEVPKTWFDIFHLLTNAIESISSKQKIILFFDEFPWLNTPRSNLLQALEYYWNQHWSHNKRIKLIICGSLASWIIKNIINNTGGLYGRVTYRVKLEPLDLYKTKKFLNAKGIKLTNKQILSIYLLTGGIPLYLNHIKRGLSASETIEQLCFTKNGLLVDEMEELFLSLFSSSDIYIKIVKEISKHRYGLNKVQLARKLNISQSGRLTTRLKDLEDAGFVLSFIPFKHTEKGTFYRIIDEYTLFYFKWIEPELRSIKRLSKAKGYWQEKMSSSSYRSWAGYSFESICYKHIEQIAKKLNLKPTSLPYSWRHIPKKGGLDNGAQIDLLFDRNDDAITICEIKNTDEPFIIDKEYARKLSTKIEIFRTKLKIKKQIFLAIISANNIKKNYYSEEIVDKVVTLDDLFKK